MRTDAKIGFAISGVLLAVLAVYVKVVPKHTTKKAENTVTLVTAPAPVDNPPVTPAAPPIAAAGDNLPVSLPPAQPAKDTVAPAVNPSPSGPFIASGQSADNALQSPPKDLAKVDEPPAVKMNEGGVYTPNVDAHPKVVIQKHTAQEDHDMVVDPTLPVVASTHQYTIKSGQTLSGIASEVYGNSRFWVAIQRENKGLNANHLKVGTKINLPDGAMAHPGPIAVDDVELIPTATPASHKIRSNTEEHTYTVQAGDNLYRISRKLFGTSRKADTLYALNKDRIGPDKSKLKLGEVLAIPAGQLASAAE